MSIKPPRKTDVLLSFRSTKEDLRDSVLWTPERKNTEIEYYNVEAIGESVTDVKVGDVVVCKWARMTEPFEIDGKRYTVTDIKEVIAVVE